MQAPIIEVRDVVKTFDVGRATLLPWRSQKKLSAVRGVSFSVYPNEVLGVVGESGSGKTTLGRCILNLETPTCGDILFRGRAITGLRHKQYRPLRR